ncbi:UNVERIFIED_CONTAM: hypothetical protein HDU68_009746 [Siphonaria sp. JEL0065]|nr:hypothetical protein HDU68_009746 [Siphonaria sp. JEL0065]
MEEELKTSSHQASHHTLVDATEPKSKSLAGSKPGTKPSSKAASFANVNHQDGVELDSSPLAHDTKPVAAEGETVEATSSRPRSVVTNTSVHPSKRGSLGDLFDKASIHGSQTENLGGLITSKHTSKAQSVYTSAHDLQAEAEVDQDFQNAVENQPTEYVAVEESNYADEFHDEEEPAEAHQEHAITAPEETSEPKIQSTKGSNASLLKRSGSKPATNNSASRAASKPVSQANSRTNLASEKNEPEVTSSKPVSKLASKVHSQAALRTNLGSAQPEPSLSGVDSAPSKRTSQSRSRAELAPAMPLSEVAGSKPSSRPTSREGSKLGSTRVSKPQSREASKAASRIVSKAVSKAASQANILPDDLKYEVGASPLSQAEVLESYSEAGTRPASKQASKPVSIVNSQAESRVNIAALETAIANSRPPSQEGSKSVSRAASKPASVIGSKANITAISEAQGHQGSHFNLAQHAISDNPHHYSKSVIAHGSQAALSQAGNSKPGSAVASKPASKPMSASAIQSFKPPASVLQSPKAVSKAASALQSPKAASKAPSALASPNAQLSPALSGTRSRASQKQPSRVSSAGLQGSIRETEKKTQEVFDEFFGAHDDAAAAAAVGNYQNDYEDELYAQAVEAVVVEADATEAAGEEFDYDEQYDEQGATEEKEAEVVENVQETGSSKPASKPASGKPKEEAIQELTKDIDYVGLISSLRREIALLKKEIGVRDDEIEGFKDKEQDLMNILELSKSKGSDVLYKNTRICLDRQKKAYQILVAKLRREIRRLKFQRNSTSDPLVEARYFPYLPRTPFSTASRQPQPGIIGNLPQRSSDYFALNPPPPTGNHLDSGNRWWWGSGPNIAVHPRETSAKSTASHTKKQNPATPKAKPETKKDNLPPIVHNPNQEEPKVGDRVCVIIDGGRVLGKEFLKKKEQENLEFKTLGIVKYVGIFDPYPGSGLWCGIKLHLPR